MTKAIAKKQTALQLFDITEKVLKELEGSVKLEIIDGDSEKVVRKFRQTAKSLQVQVEKRRIKLNRDYKDQTNSKAKVLIDRVTPVYENLDEKVKAVEKVRADKKAEAERIAAEAKAKAEKIEKERVEALDTLMENLTVSIATGLQYNLPSKAIQTSLESLQNIEITDEYQEYEQEATNLLTKGIIDAGKALASRIIFEDEQAKQEAEKKKLAKEKTAFEEKQRKAEKEIKAKEKAAKEKQEAETEKLRLKEEKVKADREALEKEKALKAEQEANAEMLKQRNRDHTLAKKDDVLFEKRKKASLVKNKADQDDWQSDKALLKLTLKNLDKAICNTSTPNFQTEVAGKMLVELIQDLKSLMNEYYDQL